MTVDAKHTWLPDGARATWCVIGGRPRLWMLALVSDEPAYVWPDEPLPYATPGTVTFRKELPTLDQAREWFPKHVELFDKVEAEHQGSVTQRLMRGSSCAEARSFSSEEHAAWLRQR